MPVKPITRRQKAYINALAMTGVQEYAIGVAGYSGRPVMNDRMLKELDSVLLSYLVKEGMPEAIGVLKRAMDPESPLNHQLAGAARVVDIYQKLRDRIGDGEGAEDDASTMSPDALARRIRELEMQAAALETIKAGQARDVTPSMDVIDDAEPITDVDPFE